MISNEFIKKLASASGFHIEGYTNSGMESIRSLLTLAAAYGAEQERARLLNMTSPHPLGYAVAYEALREAIDGGNESMTHEDAIEHVQYLNDLNSRSADVQMPTATAYEHHEYRPMGAPGEVRIHCIMESQYKLADGSIAGDFQWLVDSYKADKNTIHLIPLVTLDSAREALEAQKLRADRLEDELSELMAEKQEKIFTHVLEILK